MLRVIIIMKREVRNRGRPGIDLVEENLVDETMGRVRVKIRALFRVIEGHKLGCMRMKAAKGRLQKREVERLARGLIAGSNEVKRSGVILGSTCY